VQLFGQVNLQTNSFLGQFYWILAEFSDILNRTKIQQKPSKTITKLGFGGSVKFNFVEPIYNRSEAFECSL
jgi:hypothetical protein